VLMCSMNTGRNCVNVLNGYRERVLSSFINTAFGMVQVEKEFLNLHPGWSLTENTIPV